MGVKKELLKAGDTTKVPNDGDTVSIEYTGWLYDENAVDKKGLQCDTSKGRGDFETEIGAGKVIKGWETSVVTMGLGETSTLTITADFAYGERGFPGHIPPNSQLVFDVELKGIKRKGTSTWETAKPAP